MPRRKLKPRLRASIHNMRMLLSERRAFIRSGLWSLVLRIVGLGSGFAIGVLLARLLGPSQFGIYGLVTSVAAVGMTIAQMGTPQLAVRELSVRSASGDWGGVKMIVSQFAVATTLAGVAVGVVALAGGALARVSTFELLLIMQGAVLTLLTAYTGLFASELRGLGALIKGQSMDIMVRPAATFLIVGGLLIAGFGMDAMIALTVQNLVTLMAAAVSAVWLWHAIPRHARQTTPSKRRPWMRAALPLGAVDVLRQFDGSYGVIIVGWLASATALGVFRVALACAVLAAMPVTIFHIILAPSLSRLHAAGDKLGLQRLLSWSAGAMCAIMLPLAVGAWFLGKPAIELVFGTQYADAWLPLFLLALAQLTYAFFGMGPILLAMCDGERDLIRIYAIAVGCAVAAAIPLTVVWGGTGAAAAPIISATAIGVMSRRYAKRQLGVEITAARLLNS